MQATLSGVIDGRLFAARREGSLAGPAGEVIGEANIAPAST